MSNKVGEMILLSVDAIQSRDKDAASKLCIMDHAVNAFYWKYLRKVITPSKNDEDEDENELEEKTEVRNRRCHVSVLLILRYLERISDPACYVGDSVNYIVTGMSRPRR